MVLPILAVVAFGVSLHPLPLLWWQAALALLAAGAGGRRWLVVAAVLVGINWMAAHACQGMERPLPKNLHGVGALRTDPKRDAFGRVQAVLEVGGRRYLATAAPGPASVDLQRLRSGYRIEVRAVPTALSGSMAPAWRRRHVAGRLQVRTVHVVDEGGWLDRAANAVRHRVEIGSQGLPQGDRALLMGLSYGDDRSEPPELVHDFRAAGTSHLLAVSGQNVAVVLLAVGAMARPLPLGGRATCAGMALVLFGAIARWEPSVLRAELLAAVVLWGDLTGRGDRPRLDRLAVGVLVALLIDPFLAGSVAFLLSVAACTGIVVLARPLEARLQGPASLRRTLACALSAQIGVLPVQLPVFGGIAPLGPLIDVLMAPAVDLLLLWGAPTALVAPWAGPLLGPLLAPTELACWWLRSCAHWAASLSDGRGGAAPAVLVVITVLGGLWWAWRGPPSKYLRQRDDDPPSRLPAQGERSVVAAAGAARVGGAIGRR